MRIWPLAALAVLGGLALGAVLTTGPDPQAVPTGDQVAARMMSPFCPGLTLDECPSDQASRLRVEIERMVASGATNEEMDRWIVDNFGEVALARPGAAAAWVTPPLVALAGLGIVLLVLRRRPSTKPTGSGSRDGEADSPLHPPLPEKPAVADLTGEDEAIFEQDFKSFRRGSE